VLRADGWAQAQRDGAVSAASLDTEGFVHLSPLGEIATSASLYYCGASDLVLLLVDEAACGPELVWEAPSSPRPGAALFPHLYAPIPITAVQHALAWPPNPDGTFTLPADLAP
jgi:uncharacterized protein (DUF952 family)